LHSLHISAHQGVVDRNLLLVRQNGGDDVWHLGSLKRETQQLVYAKDA
jgi:hypothetical protein